VHSRWAVACQEELEVATSNDYDFGWSHDMPASLSVADFKMFRAVCELRYNDAYLIWDRSGQVFHDIADSFTDLKVITAVPINVACRSDEGQFALELGQCRFTSENPESNLEKFAGHCKRYFEVVADCLEIKVFTRIGFRTMFRKDLRNLDEAMAALAGLRLVNLEEDLRFGAEKNPQEIALRWQSEQIGAMLRLKAESGAVDVVLPPELEAASPSIHKEIIGLLADIDYYTVAPVERGQWDASAWIPQAIRTVRREVDRILNR